MPRRHILHDPRPETRTLIERAARLRVAGHSWAAIAKAVGRKRSTCLNWCVKYRVLWAHLYSAALAELDESAEAETDRVLREMLRVNDEKVRAEAARRLLGRIRRNDRKMRAAAGYATGRFA